MEITFKNIIAFTRQSWYYTTTKKFSSKIWFFVHYPRAFKRFFSTDKVNFKD